MTPAADSAARDRIAQWQRTSLLVGIAGVLLVITGFLLDKEQALRSYIFAYLLWTGMGLGCLGNLLMHHTVGGKWGMPIRRMSEAGARTVPYMAILIVPVLLTLPTLYPWDRPGAASDPTIHAKAAYLNVPMFLARTVLYFLIWGFYAWRLSKWSAEQDETGDERLIAKMTAVSAPGVVVFSFVTSFAFIDWIMSLEPEWFSTMYAIMFVVAQMLGAFALTIALVVLLSKLAPLKDYVTKQHLHDLGNMMFAFMVLWVYLAFSQFLIIWAGNLPEETSWYLHRLRGGWGWVALTLVVFSFAVPFVLLLSRSIKRHAEKLIMVCFLMLLMRVVDAFWIVVPSFYHSQLKIHWMDFAALFALGGLWMALFFWQLQARSLVPIRDPRLQGAPRETVSF